MHLEDLNTNTKMDRHNSNKGNGKTKPKNKHKNKKKSEDTIVNKNNDDKNNIKLDSKTSNFINTKYVDIDHLPKNFVTPPKDRVIRVYSDGIWDLFHFGHAKALEQVKKLFPNCYLLVGCCNDKLTHKMKGKTVFTDNQRYESLRHCKWVDEVIPDAPWIIDQEFLNKHKIDYVAHDDLPYNSAGMEDVYKFCKDQGIFIPTNRTDGVSTSDIITKIVHDYDAYVRRNVLRGVSAKDLNISKFKEKEILVKQKVNELTNSIASKMEAKLNDRARKSSLLKKYNNQDDNNDNNNTVPLWKIAILYWEQMSHDFLSGFINRIKFGKKRKRLNNNVNVEDEDEDENENSSELSDLDSPIRSEKSNKRIKV